jgi:Holliday junction resolvase RusA-like endonuclease
MPNASVPYYMGKGDGAVETLGPDGKTVTHVTVQVSGTPRVQSRGRTTKHSARVYNDAKRILKNFRAQVKTQLMSETPIFGKGTFILIDCCFGFYRPESHYQSNGELKPGVAWYPAKCDVDNLSKLIMDGLQGLVFDDDSHIVKLRAKKQYIAKGSSHRPADGGLPNDGSTVIRVRIARKPRDILLSEMRRIN